MAEQALEFIRPNRNRPFYAYLPLTLPHGGLHVPEDSPWPKYRGKFPEGAPLSSENGRQAPQAEPRAAFACMVSRLDRYVGQVLSLLKEPNLERDTIVFFTSDNGGIRFSNNFFLNTGAYRGSKGNLYEGGLRVDSRLLHGGCRSDGIHERQAGELQVGRGRSGACVRRRGAPVEIKAGETDE